jgi:hypothetical protein
VANVLCRPIGPAAASHLVDKSDVEIRLTQNAFEASQQRLADLMNRKSDRLVLVPQSSLPFLKYHQDIVDIPMKARDLTMSLSDQHVTELSRGAAYSFADWPNSSVPAFGAGVYTVWHNDGRFIYVGMSRTRLRSRPKGHGLIL